MQAHTLAMLEVCFQRASGWPRRGSGLTGTLEARSKVWRGAGPFRGLPSRGGHPAPPPLSVSTCLTTHPGTVGALAPGLACCMAACPLPAPLGLGRGAALAEAIGLRCLSPACVQVGWTLYPHEATRGSGVLRPPGPVCGMGHRHTSPKGDKS